MREFHSADACRAVERSRADRWRCLSHVTATRALREARELDAMPSTDALPLAGVPYVVKNSFDVEGIPTLAGGPDTGKGEAARGDAVLVQRLRAAGAVLTGIAHMDEYAYGFLGDNPHYGAVINPVDVLAYAGGSSSGSAAAVAAGIVPFSIGSDTNGSIRVPAAFCRIFSLKPTYGRLSLEGVMPLAQSLDHAGILACSLSMLERVWSALVRDAREVSPRISSKRIRVAFARGQSDQLSDEHVRRAFGCARDAYAAMPDIELPDVEMCLATASLITGYEAAANHCMRMEELPQLYSAGVVERLRQAQQIGLDTYQRGRQVMDQIRQALLERFERSGADVLVAPATPVDRIAIGQREVTLDGKTRQVADAVGLFTRPFSLAGFPVMIVPAQPELAVPGIHTALQLIAPPGRESSLFAAARQLHQPSF